MTYERHLPHGYTNQTSLTGSVVTKRYRGPSAVARLLTESNALSKLIGVLPVPRLLRSDGIEAVIETAFVSGRHGQDVLEEGRGETVLLLCGALLRLIQSLPVTLLFPDSDDDRVIVHGDYGPQNILLSADVSQIVALLDWEWAHAGDAVEDLAWAEWIIRTHHQAAAGALPALFAGYGATPPWSHRHEAMTSRCLHLCHDARAAGNEELAALWDRRAYDTLTFDELS